MRCEMTSLRCSIFRLPIMVLARLNKIPAESALSLLELSIPNFTKHTSYTAVTIRCQKLPSGELRRLPVRSPLHTAVFGCAEEALLAAALPFARHSPFHILSAPACCVLAGAGDRRQRSFADKPTTQPCCCGLDGRNPARSRGGPETLYRRCCLCREPGANIGDTRRSRCSHRRAPVLHADALHPAC